MLMLPLTAAAQTETNDSVATDSVANRVKELEAQVASIEKEKKTEEVWKRNKYVGFIYGGQTLTGKDDGLKLKSDFAFALQKSFGTIKFHKKPIENMLMLGFDIALDINFAKYKVDEAEEYEDAGNGDLGAVAEWLAENKMQLDAGLALGPIVQVAPLASLDNEARHLKVYAYYHLTPSYSGIIIESSVKSAFNLFNGVGIGLTYKAFSLGYEYRFGSAKYKSIIDADEIESSITGSTSEETTDKVRYKTTENRLVLRINY